MLTSYTGGNKSVELEADTILLLMEKLDVLFPGIKFRFINENNEIRDHMKIYINGLIVSTLDKKLESEDEIFITQALSGG